MLLHLVEPDAPPRLYGRRFDRTETRQAGSRSAAPMRKHTAPRNVPRLASGRSSRVSVLGNTKLAIADAMKATEPSMLSHAIPQGKARNCRGQNPTPRAEHIGAPDVLVGLCRAEVVHGSRERADVEEECPGELRGCSQPVFVVRPPSPQQGLDAGVLTLFVDARHPGTLRL